MDLEIENRIKKLEKVIDGETRISRIERVSIRLAMLIIGLLTLLLIILAKLSEVLHAITSTWHSLVH